MSLFSFHYITLNIAQPSTPTAINPSILHPPFLPESYLIHPCSILLIFDKKYYQHSRDLQKMKITLLPLLPQSILAVASSDHIIRPPHNPLFPSSHCIFPPSPCFISLLIEGLSCKFIIIVKKYIIWYRRYNSSWRQYLICVLQSILNLPLETKWPKICIQILVVVISTHEITNFPFSLIENYHVIPHPSPIFSTPIQCLSNSYP